LPIAESIGDEDDTLVAEEDFGNAVFSADNATTTQE
jgi:hypothetical protein